MTTVYIYALLDPRTDEIRYIGKTTDVSRRLRRHRTETGKTYRHNWLKQLRDDGLQPSIVILEVTLKEIWEQREAHWIKYFSEMGCRLTNLATGGNGAPGVSPSEETRAKISASVKSQWEINPRSISESHRQKLMEGRAKYSPTEQHRQKIREAITGIRRSDETKEKISRAKTGVSHAPLSQETRDKIGAALKGEKNGMAKFNMDEARKIRARYAEGNVSLSQLAREHGVDTKTIHRIVRNETWKE